MPYTKSKYKIYTAFAILSHLTAQTNINSLPNELNLLHIKRYQTSPNVHSTSSVKLYAQ